MRTMRFIAGRETSRGPPLDAGGDVLRRIASGAREPLEDARPTGRAREAAPETDRRDLPGRERDAPARMLAQELDGGAALRPRLTHHARHVGPRHRRLEMIDDRVALEHRTHAHLAQAEAELEILPTVLAEALVETAGLFHEGERQRAVRRPE